MNMKGSSVFLTLLGVLGFSVTTTANVPAVPNPNSIYYFPSEEAPHEGTWLQWPHNNGWDPKHVERLQDSFVQATVALHTGENVHLIVYDNRQQLDVTRVLLQNNVDMNKIDFFVWKTDDVWGRDNGPIFAYDNTGNLVVQDWGFNGWGEDADYELDDAIPKHVAGALSLPLVAVAMVNEGGSVEIDGHGTLMAKKSSILTKRNPGWTVADLEKYFRKYMGVTNFIWLEGKPGLEITDDHIDGTARFANNGKAIVTYSVEDGLDTTEHGILTNAKNANGNSYNMVYLPVTEKVIPGVNDYGIYVNFYVGNTVVLVPSFGDPMDAVAREILAPLFPTRTMVGLNFTEFYKDGGLIHCVTQQQPVASRVAPSSRNLGAKTNLRG